LERHIDYIHFNPVKHGLERGSPSGRTRLFIATCGADCCRRTGALISRRVMRNSASGSARRAGS
jgi:hypothetical protein